MLRSFKELQGGAVRTKDGDIGHLNQAYFDVDDWCIRYLVVKTGDRSHDRQVLISPYSIKRNGAGSSTLHIDLTRQQVKDSPGTDPRQPVSRLHEIESRHYYGHPAYWDGPNLWGAGAYPDFDPAGPSQDPETGHSRPTRTTRADALTDTRLRSTDEIRGYRLEAPAGRVGRVSDFIYDNETWVIRYLAIDTGNRWLSSKTVLIATDWLDEVDGSTETVSTALTRDTIRRSPKYDDSQTVYRSDEIALHLFYGKQGYWSNGEPSRAHDTL
jgi:hypothetical protein